MAGRGGCRRRRAPPCVLSAKQEQDIKQILALCRDLHDLRDDNVVLQYLRSRDLCYHPYLYHPNEKHKLPAMVARVRDSAGQITALHENLFAMRWAVI